MNRLKSLLLIASLILFACSDGGSGGGFPVQVAPESASESQPECAIEPAGSMTLLSGGSISFSSSVTDPDGLVGGYRWDFGGGADNVQVKDPGDVVFSNPGTYTVTLTLIDKEGEELQASSMAEVRVLSSPSGPIDSTIVIMQGFLDRDGDGVLDADALTRLAEINDPKFIDVDEHGGIQMVLVLNNDLTQDDRDELAAIGVTIETTHTDKHGIIHVQVRVPFDKINSLSGLSFIDSDESVTLPQYPVFQQGSIMTQADAVMQTDLLRDTFGLDGAGVKIGVISDGIGSRADSQATGDLPATIQYKSFRSDGNIDAGCEGTAMLEIIHDIAPGAELYFCNGGSSFGFIDAVEFMAAEDDPSTTEVEGFDLDILIDDLNFFNAGPYDGTSYVSEAITGVVETYGKRYFTVSANYAEKHYAFDFQAQGDSNYHDFSTSEIAGATDRDFVFTVWANYSVWIYIQWDDPDFYDADSDFQPVVYRYDETSQAFNSLCTGGTVDNNDLYVYVPVNAQLPNLSHYSGYSGARHRWPTEYINIINRTGESQRFSLRLMKIGGPDERRHFDVYFYNAATLEVFTPQNSVPNLGDAREVITIGGVPWYSPEEKVYYSGYGPTKDGRQKPELMAPTEVCVTGSGGFGSNPSYYEQVECDGNVFAGTSASSPHAAAVAALLLQADPSLSNEDIKIILQDTADDILDPGVDDLSGWGRINAYNAIKQALNLESIDITNSDFTLTASGEGQQLNVVGHYTGGIEADVTSSQHGTTYVSSDTAVAAVSADGLVTAVADGTAVITATNGGFEDAINVIVSIPVTLSSIDITNGSVSFSQSGDTQQLSVVGHYSDGSTNDLSTSASGTTYESSDTSVATVSSDGLVTAVANGTATITATNSGFSDAVSVSVSIPVILTSIDITNNGISLTQQGATQQLTVIGHYSDGSTNDLSTSASGTTYESSDTTVATVSANGLVTAVADGTATITATNSGFGDTVIVSVSISSATLEYIDITDATISLQPGNTNQLSVIGHYSDGSTNDLSYASSGTTYTSSDTGIATVTADGLVTAVAEGVAGITATNNGLSDTVTVLINQPPSANIYTIMEEEIFHGEMSRIGWSCTNATRAVIEPGHINAIPTGSMHVFPTETTTYTLTAYGPGGTDTDSTTIEVTPPGALSLELVGQIGGYVSAVAASGDYAYVGVGPSLHVLNISNPAQPLLIGRVMLHENIYLITVSGSYAYVIDATGIHVINVVDPAAPYIEGRVVGFVGQDVEIVGDYAYVAGYGSGVIIIDVSNPSDPVPVGSYLYAEHWEARSLEISGSYAYVIGEYTYSTYGNPGLWVLDISNQVEPVFAGHYEGSEDFWDIDVSNSHAYIGAESGLVVVDVSNPAAPSYAGSMGTSSTALRVAVSNGHAYVACYGGSLVVMSDDPSYPTIENTLEAIGYTEQIDLAVSGDYGFFALGNLGMQIVDITVPDTPAAIAWYQTTSSVNDLFASNPYCYVADSKSGLYVVDATDPFNPVHIGQYCEGETHHVADVAINGNYAYVSDDDGLVVLDVSDPSNMTSVSFSPINDSLWGIDFYNNYVYLCTNWSSLRIYDMSDPSNPSYIGQAVTSGIDYKVSAYYGNYVYTAKSSAGLSVIDVTDPMNPIVHPDIEVSSNDVDIYGGHAYVAANPGLLVYDLSSPASPVQVSQYDQGRYGGYRVAVSRGFAFVTIEGLYVINVSDPGNPQLSDIYSQGKPTNVAVDGRYVYVSSLSGGISVLRTSLTPADIALPSSGNIRVTFASKNASFDNDFLLLSPGSQQVIFQAIDANVGNTYELGSYLSGDVLEFGLYTPEGYTFSTDHDSNHDECIHVIVTQPAANTWRLSWEDGDALGDEDFNDVVVDVELYSN